MTPESAVGHLPTEYTENTEVTSLDHASVVFTEQLSVYSVCSVGAACVFRAHR